MIDKISTLIALKIKRINPEETASVEVMSFSLIILISTFATLFLALGGSLLLGTIRGTGLVLVSFAFLRFFSGGFHFKRSEACIISTAIGSIVIPFIHLNSTLIIILTLLSVLIISIFAPRGINQSRIFNRSHYKLLKLISIFIVIINIYVESEVLTITYLVQAVTLLFVKGGDNNDE